MIERDNCPFCYPDSKERPHFREYGQPGLDKTVVLETTNLKVYPDILPVCEGHWLVVTKDHALSLAVSPELGGELWWVIDRLEQQHDQRLLIVEHGSVKENGKIQSVGHRHAHVLALGKDKAHLHLVNYMRDVLAEKGISCLDLGNLDPSPVVNMNRLYQQLSYLYVQYGREGLIAYDEIGNFPSQITQKAISRLANLGAELDWKQIPTNNQIAKESVWRIVLMMDRCNLL